MHDAASNLEHRRPRHPLRLLQLSQPAASELHLGGHPRRGRRVLGRTVTGYPISYDLGDLKFNKYLFQIIQIQTSQEGAATV